MVKVSVILTTYNSASQIMDVINSIMSQQGQEDVFEIELLVVDDCSTDNTINLLEQNNISYLSTNNNTGGPNQGRNIALNICTGDFICIADHDDIWFPDKLKKLLWGSNLAPIVTSGYILSDSSSKKEIVRVSRSSNGLGYLEFQRNETFLNKLSKSNTGQQTYLGSILFSSSLKHILFEEEYGMIDFDWILRLFYNQKSVEVCSSLYLRKVSNQNLSLVEEYRLNDYNYSLRSILYYKSEFPYLVKIAKKRLNGSLARYYYLVGNMSLARIFFLKSSIGLKTILYLITTFVGSKIVKRYFKVFG